MVADIIKPGNEDFFFTDMAGGWFYIVFGRYFYSRSGESLSYNFSGSRSASRLFLLSAYFLAHGDNIFSHQRTKNALDNFNYLHTYHWKYVLRDNS